MGYYALLSGMQKLEAAFDDGCLSGLDTHDVAGDCPFPQEERALRRAWLHGFSWGRSEAAEMKARA